MYPHEHDRKRAGCYTQSRRTINDEWNIVHGMSDFVGSSKRRGKKIVHVRSRLENRVCNFLFTYFVHTVFFLLLMNVLKLFSKSRRNSRSQTRGQVGHSCWSTCARSCSEDGNIFTKINQPRMKKVSDELSNNLPFFILKTPPPPPQKKNSVERPEDRTLSSSYNRWSARSDLKVMNNLVNYFWIVIIVVKYLLLYTVDNLRSSEKLVH